MPTEVVLLSHQPLDSQTIYDEFQRMFPGGVLLDFPRIQQRQCVTPRNEVVLSFFPSREVCVAAHGDVVVEMGGVGGFAYWTDVVIPFGDTGHGWALTKAIATAIGGCATGRT